MNRSAIWGNRLKREKLLKKTRGGNWRRATKGRGGKTSNFD